MTVARPVIDQFVDIGDLSFRIREGGSLEAPVVVFLHCLGANSTDWNAVTTRLAKDFNVISFDMRGHGQSSWPGEYSYELMRDDLLMCMDELEIEEFALVGHAMGGTVSYLFAEDHSDRLTHLIIEDTAPPTGVRIPPPPDKPHGRVSFDWPVVAAILKQLAHPDPAWWERVPEITVPTLIISGGNNSPVPPARLADVASCLPEGQMITIESGHDIHAARPDDFVDAVRKFLQSK